jgi:flagellar biosynthesis protein FlhG
VATPEPTSITDAYALLKALNVRAGFERENTTIHVIANRVSNHEEGVNLYNKLNVVVGKFLNIQLNFLGTVPKDDNVGRAVMQQKPVSLIYPNSAASRHFLGLAEGLLNGENTVEEQKSRGLAFAVLRMLKNKERKAES